MFTLGQLPVGPSIGPAAAILILGSNGVAAAAAAGVLLAVTGTAGSLGYAAWAVTDRIVTGRASGSEIVVTGRAAGSEIVVVPVAVTPT
jgi:hypothetical protein